MKKLVLNTEAQKQIEDFYKTSDRYVKLLCSKYQILPLITKDDIYSLVYEKLCIYVSDHSIDKYGYQKLAEIIVFSARWQLIRCNYYKKEFVLNENNDESINSLFESKLPYFNFGETNIIAEDNKKLIKELLKCLPEKERKYVIDFYLKEKTISEIAEEEDCFPQLIRYYVKQGIKKIKKNL